MKDVNGFYDEFGDGLEGLPSDFVEVDGEVVPESELEGLEKLIFDVPLEEVVFRVDDFRGPDEVVDEALDAELDESRLEERLRKEGGGS